MASPQNSPEVIDVDADEHPRIAGGTGKPDAPFEIASSDSEDESPAIAARRTSLIVRPVMRGYLKKKGRAPFSYE